MQAKQETEKLKELILHLCVISEGDEAFGSVKLNKLLFYVDFAAYLKFGNPVTGQEYQKLKNGPAPRLMLPLMAKMTQAKELAIATRDYYGRAQKRPVALRSPNLSSFTSDEIALVDQAVRMFWHMNGSAISEASHQFWGWKLAGENDVIPYGAALLKRRELTAQEKQWAQEIDMTGVEVLLAS